MMEMPLVLLLVREYHFTEYAAYCTLVPAGNLRYFYLRFLLVIEQVKYSLHFLFSNFRTSFFRAHG